MAWGLARSFFPDNPPYTTRMKRLSLVDLCIIVVVGVLVTVYPMLGGTEAWIWAGVMLGLFLLGLLSRRAGSRAVFAGVAGGIAVILWMTFSTNWTGPLEPLRSPFHHLLTLVIGTGTILLVGRLAGLFADRRREVPAGSDTAG